MTGNEQFEIKIAYIGGGSRYWAYELMSDLALCPHITGHLALYDIDQAAAETNVKVAEDIFGRPDSRTRFKVTAAKTAATALKGADFVVCSIEPGPTEMRYADLEIPRKYGILQPVGDTTGPGGIVRGLRAVPVKAHYAHLVMKHCPGAWVINYTNPMTLCTAALYAAEPAIKAFGCCHEVFGTQSYLAGLVEKWFRVKRPDRREIMLDIAGVNHFTFATAASWNGHDLWPRLRTMVSRDTLFNSRARDARERKKKQQWFSSNKLVALDFMRRFDTLGAAGDRHLAEFVPWYTTDEDTLHRWGVVLTPYAWRLKRSKQGRRSTTYSKATLNPSGEEGVAQMLALLGVRPLDTNVNLPNTGQMGQSPAGAVVETYAQFRQDSIRPVVAQPLNEGAAALVNRVIGVQEMTLEAAMHRDKDLAFHALLNDPLVTIPTDKAWKMFNEMLGHVKKHLPGWRV
ncbi:MAG: alpha-galactosidase [Chitinivibrionales bacterium]|nr:alpha-galactosidase [Chitinivibrionales bacterium]